ncbi:MAG: tail fiber domain-containing protein [Chthoniobacterales bacterium]
MFACIALSPRAHAAPVGALRPPPDGGYFNQTTAEGDGALFSLTTGYGNTALGFNALHANTEGSFNTATGRNALLSNTTGFHNTATGGAALLSNTDGIGNTATGRAAMGRGTTGSENTANGWQTLFNNTGSNNTANGAFALYANTTGNNNTALGNSAGALLTTGNFNIDIANEGVAGESSTIRIGAAGDQTATFIAGISGATVAGGVTVVIDANGQLGTIVSSQHFKEAIKPMDEASEAILALKPVTFRYKHELDRKGIPQFGLVAEEVEKVNPDLVARDAQGKVYTVRYEAVNAMLLNEFLKQHRNVQELEATAAQQQKEIKALTASLKKQASQIQKVSAQVAARKPATQLVVDNQ